MASPLLAGTSAVDITPPLGVSIPGGFTDRKVRTIHDPLYATALVLKNAGASLAFVSCDLIGIDRETVMEIRSLASGHTGIPESNIMISATHTHTGPHVARSFWGVGEADPDYMGVLVRKVAGSIALAAGSLQDARIGFGYGREPGLVFNRRLHASDGRVFMNFVGRERARELGLVHRGPIDPTVGVIRVDGPGGAPMAIVVNYALHNAILGNDFISAGFPAALRTLLKRALGDVQVLFWAGPCGDVNHIDISNPKQPSGYAEALRIGTILGGEAIKVWANIETSPEVDIRVASSLMMIAERPIGGPSDDGPGAFGEDSDIIRAQYAREREAIAGRPIEQVLVEISAVAMNDAVVVTNPAELFVEFGLGMRSGSPFGYTFPVELTNGYVGYVPTRKAFGEGGYEPRRTAFTSRLSVDAGDIILQETLKLMKSLKS